MKLVLGLDQSFDIQQMIDLYQTNVSNMPNTTFAEIEFILDSPNFKAILIFLYTIVFLSCFFGNLIVLLVIGMHHRMRSITNLILANLAGTDFCVSIFCVLQNLTIYLIKSWFFGNVFCKLYHFIDRMSYTASIFLLVLISLERFLAIVHNPVWKRALHRKNIQVIICSLWIVSGVINAPRLYYFHTVSHKFIDENGDIDEEVICLADFRVLDTKYYDLATFLLLYLIPLFIITLAYLRIGVYFWRSTSILKKIKAASPIPPPQPPSQKILKSLKSQDRKSNAKSVSFCEDIVQEFPETDKSYSGEDFKNNSSYKRRNSEYVLVKVEYDQRLSISIAEDDLEKPRQSVTNSAPYGSYQPGHAGEKRVILMLIMIVVVFVICNFPYHFRKVLQHFHPDLLPNKLNYYYPLITISTNLLIYINSGINPILYAFFSKRFQACFMELFGDRIKEFFCGNKLEREILMREANTRKLIERGFQCRERAECDPDVIPELR